MNKKMKFVPILLSAVLIGSCLTGCTDLLSSNQKRDMEQVVASVDISKSEDFSSGGKFEKYADAVNTQTVLKRDLVAYFVNQGYSLIQNSGYSYSDAFDLMLESLINRKLVSQYAKVYFFENSEGKYTIDGYNEAIKDSAHAEIEGLKYFLSEEEYEQCLYSLRVIVNNSIDSTESQNYIKSDDDDVEYESSVRTTPDGVDTEVEDYYDVDYRIYTGKNAADSCGSYEKLDNSTPTTRKKAYNDFLSGLKNNYLLNEDEENLDKIEELDYWYIELQGQLETALIDKLGDELESKAEAALTEEFVTAKYTEIFNTQKDMYDKSADDFETAIDSIGDSSFVVYSPVSGYGFVYNILLPFSTTQSVELSAAQNNTALTDLQKYEVRADLLKNIEATDQRGSWLKGSTDYSFKASEKNVTAYGASDYLFFENNMTKSDRYESIDKYYGHYSYNGKVEFDEYEKDYNGYTLTPNKLKIDDFIIEMENYLGFADLNASGSKNRKYMTNVVKEDGTIDYSAFLYYEGKVDVGVFDANKTFVEDTDAYKAMSVVNELMFAYNTDTAGLNSYLGYSVSAYDTSYVKEFEYAAKKAVESGVGAYTVCPSDYGWHIMYCTFVYPEGATYSFNWADVETKGTFSYYFYEALKDSTSGNTKQVYETQVVNTYSNSTCVEKHKDRYADYASLDKNG